MILEVKDLAKSFGGLLALNLVSFSIEEGEVIGLIGPNESGTSTTFNVITETLPASSGQVIFGGVNLAWWFVGTHRAGHAIGQPQAGPSFFN